MFVVDAAGVCVGAVYAVPRSAYFDEQCTDSTYQRVECSSESFCHNFDESVLLIATDTYSLHYDSSTCAQCDPVHKPAVRVALYMFN